MADAARPIGLFSPEVTAWARQRARSRAVRAHQQAIAGSEAAFAQRISEISQRAPDLDPGVVVALAQGGATDDQIDMLHAEAAKPSPGGLLNNIPGGGVIGNVAGIAGDIIGGGVDVVTDVGDAAFQQVVKPATRLAFTAAQSLYEETTTALIRAPSYANVRTFKDGDGSWWGNYWDVMSTSGSAGRRVLGDLVTGDDIDLGTGFFAGGEVGRLASESMNRHVIDGVEISVGRQLAKEVAEPGTTGFNVLSGAVDGTLSFVFDPVEVLGKTSTLARQGAKVFAPVQDTSLTGRAAEALARAGGIPAHRKTTNAAKFQSWLAGDGRRFVDHLTGETSALNIDKAFDGRLQPRLVAALQDADTPDDVAAIIEHAVLGTDMDLVGGATIRDIPKAPKPVWNGATIGRGASPTTRQRLGAQMPRQSVRLGDHRDLFTQAERYMTNARVPFEKQEEVLSRLARLPDDAKGTFYEALLGEGGVMEAVADTLITDFGADGGLARALTSAFKQDLEDVGAYLISEVADDAGVDFLEVNGKHHVLATPGLWNQYLNTSVPLPNARDIRRATSQAKRLWDNGAFQGIENATTFLQEGIWKKVVLARPAWTVRVLAEEQLRMAASGMDSLFNHPLSFIKWLTGRADSVVADDEFLTNLQRANRMLDEEDAARVEAFDGLFESLVDEGLDEAEAMSRATAQITEEFGDPTRAERFREGFVARRQIINQLEKETTEYGASLAATRSSWVFDPSRPMPRGKTVADRGSDQWVRGVLDEVSLYGTDPLTKRVANGGLFDGDGVEGAAEGIEGIKEWFWSGAGQKFRKDMAAEADRGPLRNRTGSDAYVDWLVKHLEQRLGNDEELLDLIARGRTSRKRGRGALRERVEAMRDAGLGPDEVLVDKWGFANREGAGMWDKATEELFSVLMSRPTNFLSRSPAFRQSYWQRVEELADRLDADALADVTQRAIDNDLGDLAQRLRKVTPDAADNALRSADIDRAAKMFALDQTRQLLYDVSERSQFFDVTRHIFPFGEAWKEVLTRWAKIGTDRPQIPNRARKIIAAGRDDGFFYEDQYGNEVFTYPFSAQAVDALAGVPVPLKGSISGLNLIGEVIPGIGPALQVPAAFVLPDTPDFDEVKNLLAPFGLPDPDAEGAFGELIPSWMEKALIGLSGGTTEEQRRQYASAVKSVSAYLASTGEYDLNGLDAHDEMNRLLTDAKRQAKSLYLVRGLAQSFSPSAPSPEFVAHDRDGELMVLSKLTERFYELRQDDPDTAVGMFLTEFGKQAFIAMQSKTIGIAPPTKAVGDFLRANEDIAADYPEMALYLAPNDPESPFDFAAYRRQIAKGERKVLTPEEFIKEANHRVAKMVYDNNRRAAGERVSENERVQLAALRDDLRSRYPGFHLDDFDADSRPRRIEQLERMLLDERIADHPVIPTLATYMNARQQVVNSARERGVLGWDRAKNWSRARSSLWTIGTRLANENPDFEPLWTGFFESEVIDDD